MRTKKIIILSLLILFFGIFMPLFCYYQSGEWQALLLLLAILAGFLLSIFLYLKKPALILALILPTIIFGQVTTLRIRDWYYEITLGEILIILISVLFVLQILTRRKIREIKFPFLLVILILYLALAVLSLGWAHNLSRALIAIRALLFHLAILFLIINLVRTKKDLKIALYSLPLTGFLVSIQLISKVASLGGFNGNYTIAREWIITPVGRWVYIAAVIILTLPLTYALALNTKKIWLKIILSLQIVLGFTASALTLGKGEIIAALSGLSYFFTKQKIQKLLALVILIVILLLIAFPLASYSRKLLERIYNTASDPNTNFRITEGKVAFKLFFQKPILGYGVGNLKLEYKNLLPWSIESESNNFFLQIVLELGLIGLAILILIIRQIYRELKKMKALAKEQNDKILYLGFVSTMIIVLINALLEVTLVGLYYGIIFWYIVGLLLVQNRFLAKK